MALSRCMLLGFKRAHDNELSDHSTLSHNAEHVSKKIIRCFGF